MNIRVIRNAISAISTAPTMSIHGLSAVLCGRPNPATCGCDERFAYTGRSNASCEVGVASRGGSCAAIGGPHVAKPPPPDIGSGIGAFGISGGGGSCGAGVPGSVVGEMPTGGPGVGECARGIGGGCVGGRFTRGCGCGVRRSRGATSLVASSDDV